MKILVVTQYFWPETFRINDLVLGLKQRGHEVEILTGKPNYPKGEFYFSYSFLSKREEIWNDIVIHRVPLFPRGKAQGLSLILNYVSFAFFSSLRALFLKGDFDKIFVFEPSPITVGLPAIVLKWRKKAPIYFWVQDLWPQSVIAANGSTNKYVIKILDNLTRWIYKKSDRILIQSEAFRNNILSQGVKTEKVVFYPNSVEAFFKVKPIKVEIANIIPKGFIIMFAGNIGEAQDFETVIKAAKLVKAENSFVKWVILGDGRKHGSVKTMIAESNLEEQIFLLGSYPVEQMPDFLRVQIVYS